MVETLSFGRINLLLSPFYLDFVDPDLEFWLLNRPGDGVPELSNADGEGVKMQIQW